MKEHYGVEISVSTLRQQTQQHAKQMYEQAQEDVKMPERAGCKQQIGEMDDCMIPIITIDENADDKRKNKKLQWKAATLSLVHDSVTPRAVGNVTDAGRNSAILAGFGQQTHSVGDGAPWIAKQVQAQFGEKSSYLVDFYHVCEYLAAQHCTTEDKQTWLEKKCVKE